MNFLQRLFSKDTNAGFYNSGSYNSGDGNSGDCNSGCGNSGDWNSGSGNSGYLNTTSPPLRIFDKETDVGPEDIEWPNFMYRIQVIDDDGLPVPYKEACQKAWNEAPMEDRAKVFSLPNWDNEKFKEITGVDAEREFWHGCYRLSNNEDEEAAEETSTDDTTEIINNLIDELHMTPIYIKQKGEYVQVGYAKIRQGVVDEVLTNDAPFTEDAFVIVI